MGMRAQRMCARGLGLDPDALSPGPVLFPHAGQGQGSSGWWCSAGFEGKQANRTDSVRLPSSENNSLCNPGQVTLLLCAQEEAPSQLRIISIIDNNSS